MNNDETPTTDSSVPESAKGSYFSSRDPAPMRLQFFLRTMNPRLPLTLMIAPGMIIILLVVLTLALTSLTASLNFFGGLVVLIVAFALTVAPLSFFVGLSLLFLRKAAQHDAARTTPITPTPLPIQAKNESTQSVSRPNILLIAPSVIFSSLIIITFLFFAWNEYQPWNPWIHTFYTPATPSWVTTLESTLPIITLVSLLSIVPLGLLGLFIDKRHKK